MYTRPCLIPAAPLCAPSLSWCEPVVSTSQSRVAVCRRALAHCGVSRTSHSLPSLDRARYLPRLHCSSSSSTYPPLPRSTYPPLPRRTYPPLPYNTYSHHYLHLPARYFRYVSADGLPIGRRICYSVLQRQILRGFSARTYPRVTMSAVSVIRRGNVWIS